MGFHTLGSKSKEILNSSDSIGRDESKSLDVMWVQGLRAGVIYWVHFHVLQHLSIRFFNTTKCVLHFRQNLRGCICKDRIEKRTFLDLFMFIGSVCLLGS